MAVAVEASPRADSTVETLPPRATLYGARPIPRIRNDDVTAGDGGGRVAGPAGVKPSTSPRDTPNVVLIGEPAGAADAVSNGNAACVAVLDANENKALTRLLVERAGPMGLVLEACVVVALMGRVVTTSFASSLFDAIRSLSPIVTPGRAAKSTGSSLTRLLPLLSSIMLPCIMLPCGRGTATRSAALTTCCE